MIWRLSSWSSTTRMQGRLIIVWLEVRVLPGPPRSPAQTEISRFSANSPELAAIRHAFCLCTLPIELRGPFRGLCLCPGKLHFPTAETGVGRDSVRMLSQCDGKPSISRCLDHSAGKSVRRATPVVVVCCMLELA